MTKHHTKTILATLALLGFLSITAFWWVGMHEGGDHNCISATIQSSECPNATTPEAAAFHLNTLQSFSSTILQTFSLFSVLLAVALLAIFGVSRFAANFSPSVVGRTESRAISPPGEYQHWLSLLEHSPSMI